MHEFVSFNHQILYPRQISLHAVSSAALYGKGVFTTVAIYKERPFLWKKHWQRLTENAARLSIDTSEFSESSVRESFQNLIDKNNIINARARLTFFDESSSDIWKIENEAKTGLLITTAEFRPAIEKLSLNVSPYPVNSRSPLVNIKSCNYLENICAIRKAKEQGFDEAVRLNEKDEVVSACLANIFWMRGEKIFTPTVTTGALRGTTREFIIENFDVFEVDSRLAELEKADTVFITSAGIGIVEIGNIGIIKYRPTEDFEKVKQLFDQFREITQN